MVYSTESPEGTSLKRMGADAGPTRIPASVEPGFRPLEPCKGVAKGDSSLGLVLSLLSGGLFVCIIAPVGLAVLMWCAAVARCASWLDQG